MESRINKEKGKLTYKIMQHKTKKGWKETTESIKRGINENETISNKEIIQKFQDDINQKTINKTKMKYLTENKMWEAAKRPEYINKLSRTEASTIFKTRARMLDIKHNFKWKYPDTLCRKCKDHEETQEHILEQCQRIHENNETTIPKTEIFQTNHEEISLTAKKIITVMEKLNE